MRAIVFLLNRYRAERGPMVLFALLVAATAFLAAAAPRGFNRVADDALRHVVEGARPIERNLQLGQLGVISGGSGLQSVAEVGRQLEGELPESVRRLIVDRSALAESANWSIRRDPGQHPAWVRFRFGTGIEGRVTYVDGRPPTGATTSIPGVRGTLPGEPEDATVFEVALAIDVAETLGVEVGDRLELIPDTDDVLVGQFSSPVRAAADIVGVYRVNDSSDPFWMNDPALQLPSVIVISPDLQLIYSTALLSEDAYPALIRKGLPARYTWREYIDPDRLDADALPAVTEELRQMITRYPPFVTSLQDAETTTLRTGLLGLVEAYAAERRTSEAILLTAALGPAAVAAAAMALLALLVVHRRERPDALLRGRGASGGQLLGSYALEGMVLAVPAALLGLGTALATIDARASALGIVAPLLVAVTAAGILVATAVRHVRSAAAAEGRDVPAAGRPQPRRLVAEGVVVVVAVGGAFLLRQRGIAGGSTTGQLAGADPLLAAAPALVGLAAGLLVARLYPLPVHAAAWFADAWRGGVPALGIRRAARSSHIGSWPLLVILITMAIGAFSATIAASVERGQAGAAWQAVGADFAISPGSRPFPPDFDPAGLPGVAASAGVHVETVSLGGRAGARAALHAVDTAGYAAVAEGTGADPELPGQMGDPPDPGEPLPALVSERALADGPRPIRAGDEIEMLVSSRLVTIRVSAVRSTFPGIDARSPWVVVPRDALGAAIDRELSTDIVLLRAPETAIGDMQAAIEEVLPAAIVTGRAQMLDDLRSDPLVGGVGAGFAIAVIVAVVYAALATVVAMVVVAAQRRGETAHLRILGFSDRDLLALSIIEHAPAVLAATIGGVALGVGVAWFAAPGLDLTGLIGSAVEVPLFVDWSVIGLLVGAIGLLFGVAIWASARAGRRANLSRSARQGIE